MRAEDLPLAVLALLTLVTLIPAWMHVLGSAGLTGQQAWLAGLLLPATCTLFITSWVRPSLVNPVLGGFVLAGVMVLAPQLWSLTGMAADRLADGSLAKLAVQVALPVLLVTYAAGLGWSRATEVLRR